MANLFNVNRCEFASNCLHSDCGQDSITYKAKTQVVKLLDIIVNKFRCQGVNRCKNTRYSCLDYQENLILIL